MAFSNTRLWEKSTIASLRNAATTSPATACSSNGHHITATSLSADSLSLIPRVESPSMVALASDDASTKEGASSPSANCRPAEPWLKLCGAVYFSNGETACLSFLIIRIIYYRFSHIIYCQQKMFTEINLLPPYIVKIINIY